MMAAGFCPAAPPRRMVVAALLDISGQGPTQSAHSSPFPDQPTPPPGTQHLTVTLGWLTAQWVASSRYVGGRMNWWAISQTAVPSSYLGILRRGEGQRRGRHSEVAEGAGQAVRPGRAGAVTQRGRTEAVPVLQPHIPPACGGRGRRKLRLTSPALNLQTPVKTTLP